MPVFCDRIRVPPSAGCIISNPAVRVFLITLLVLLVSLTGTMLGVAQGPVLSASQPTLFKGEMAKGIKIQMKLQRDGTSLSGTYFYELYGRDIELKGTISETGDVFLQEFVKGKNTGSFRGKFVSSERLEGRWFKPGSDKGRAFFLVKAEAGSSVSAGTEPIGALPDGLKPHGTLRPRAKEPAQAATQPVSEPSVSEPTSKSTRSAAAPKTESQAQPTAKTAIPVIQEIPLVQQESKAKVPVEPVPRASGSGTGGSEEPKMLADEQAPLAAAPVEASRPAGPGVGQSGTQPQEKPQGVTGRVVGRVIDAVGTQSLPPWMTAVLNLRFLAAFGGLLLLAAGLAWLAIVAGGMAGFRDNSAFFRKVHAQGLAFLPGVFLLALGVGAVLAVFVE